MHFLKSHYLLGLLVDVIVIYIPVCWCFQGDQAIDIEEFTHADPSLKGVGILDHCLRRRCWAICIDIHVGWNWIILMHVSWKYKCTNTLCSLLFINHLRLHQQIFEWERYIYSKFWFMETTHLVVKWIKNPKFLKVKFPKKLIKYCSLCVYFVLDKLDNVFCRCAMLRLIKLLYLRLSFFSFQQQNQNTYLYNVNTFLFFWIKRRMKNYFKSVYLVIALLWIDFVHFKSVMEHVKVNQKYVDNVAIGHIIFHEKHI